MDRLPWLLAAEALKNLLSQITVETAETAAEAAQRAE